MTELLLLAHTAGCALACWYSMVELNACTRKTHLGARLSFAFIAVGAFAAMINPPPMDLMGVGQTMVVLGIGAGFLANRRKCVCLNCIQRPGHRAPAPIDWRELHGERRAADRDHPHGGVPT